MIMSTEHNFTQGSRQYEWMEQDLKNVNRSLTSWVVVAGHRAMYTSQNILGKWDKCRSLIKLRDLTIYTENPEILVGNSSASRHSVGKVL